MAGVPSTARGWRPPQSRFLTHMPSGWAGLPNVYLWPRGLEVLRIVGLEGQGSKSK